MDWIDNIDFEYERYLNHLIDSRDAAEDAAYEAWLDSQPVIEDEDWEDEYERAATADEHDRF